MEKSSAFQRWNNYMREQNEKAQKDYEEKLLPCPFCGGEAFLEVIPPHEHHFVNLPPYEGGAFIACTSCACSIGESTPEEVIAAWNRRVQPQQSEAAHGRIIYRNRPQHYVSYKLSGLTEDGNPLYKREHHILENNPIGYCSECGKRLCSRFTDYCPSCGAKMGGGEKDAN